MRQTVGLGLKLATWEAVRNSWDSTMVPAVQWATTTHRWSDMERLKQDKSVASRVVLNQRRRRSMTRWTQLRCPRRSPLHTAVITITSSICTSSIRHHQAVSHTTRRTILKWSLNRYRMLQSQSVLVAHMATYQSRIITMAPIMQEKRVLASYRLRKTHRQASLRTNWSSVEANLRLSICRK